MRSHLHSAPPARVRILRLIWRRECLDGIDLLGVVVGSWPTAQIEPSLCEASASCRRPEGERHSACVELHTSSTIYMF